MNLDAVKDLRVLVVGEAIYDHYIFCEPLGRSTKESIISVRIQSEETYEGGVWASAAHIADLCHVDVWHGAQAIVNTKYIGRHSQKLFSVHSSKPLTDGYKPRDVTAYDVVIVFDYGHGFFVPELREHIMRNARFLAVNAQTNSSNYGFNRISDKWPTAHYCVVDETEARLAAHEQHAEIESVILKLPYSRCIVTLGDQGAIGYGNREFYREKALTNRPVDLMGAGDAVMAVTAPFASIGASIKELVHLANVAGAIKVGIMGHQSHVTRELLEQNL